MIPVLFERDEINFQSNGIGQLPNVVDSYAHEIGNAEYELNLVYPTVNDIDGYPNSIWKELKVTERQILYKPSHSRKPHAFRIYNYEIDSIAQTITVYGRSRAYDLGSNVVKSVNISNQTPQTAMNMMKANLVEPTDFDFYSDMSTTSSTKWERQSGLSTIMGEEGSLIQYWGGEVLRENTRISLYNRIGKDNVTTLRLGKNIQQLNYDLRTDSMVTAIIPFYRYTPEGENQEERVVTGNTVKSSKFNNYRLPYYQFVEYNEQDDKVTNLTTLNSTASNWFKEHPNTDEPTLTVNVNMIDVAESTEYAELLRSLEQVNVFDTVSVYVAEYNIDMVIKVVSLKYDGFNERNLEVELGTATKGMFDSLVSPQFVSIGKQLDEIRNMGLVAQVSADGKNTNYHGVSDPNEIDLIGDNGDVYFRNIGTEKQMWQYQDGQWNLILDTSRIDTVEKEVTAAIEQAETDRQTAEQNFEQAVVDAATYTDVKAQEFDTQLDTVKLDVSNTVIKADNALIQADKAIVDAGFAKVDANEAMEKFYEFDPMVRTALSNSQTALNDSGEAYWNAEQAAIKSGTALTNAQTALNRVGAVEEVTGGLKTNYDALTQTVGLKADKTTVNGINQTVTQHDLDISANATAVGLKADKSTVDTINQTVSKHTTDIKVNAEGLKLKADSSTVNTIKGTVDTHTGQISANSNAITAKADKSTVNTLTGRVQNTEAGLSIANDKLELTATKSEVETLTDGSSVVNKTEILSGNTIFTDKSDDAIVHIEVDGKSVGGGRNLLRNGSFEDDLSNWNSWGISNQLETDSTSPSGQALHVIGKGGRYTYVRSSLDNGEPLTVGKTYTLSANIRGRGQVRFMMEGQNSIKYFDLSENNQQYSFTFEYTSGTVISLYGWQDDTEMWLHSIMLSEGSSAIPYELPAPTPDYPVAINSLNNIDVVSSVGKENLLTDGILSLASNGSSISVDSSIKFNGDNTLKIDMTTTTSGVAGKKYIKLKGGTLYTYSMMMFSTKTTNFSGSKPLHMWVSTTESSGHSERVIKHTPTISANQWTKVYITFSTPEDSSRYYMRPFIYGAFPSGTVLNVADIKVEESEILTPHSQALSDIDYDTPNPTTYKTNISLPEPLRSVGDIKDRLFRDTDGLWKVERNVGYLLANGTNGYTAYNDMDISKEARINNSYFIKSAGSPIISNRFKGIRSTTWARDDIYIVGTGGTSAPYGLSTRIGVNEDPTTFFTQNPTEFIFELATPTIETLSDDMQQKLNNIQSFKGSNYVYTVSPDKSSVSSYVEEQLTPTLHAVFKSRGWYDKFLTDSKVSLNEAKLTIQADEIASKVSNVEFNELAGKQTATDSRLTQTANSLTSQIGTVTTDLTGKATKSEFSTLTQTVSGIGTRVGNSEGKITAIEQTVNGIQTTVASKADKSQITQLSTQISSKVESSTYNSKMTQLDSSINLRVTKGDVTGQFNIEAGQTLIKNNKIFLDGNTYTMGTAFVDDIKAKSLDAVYADIATLKTKVLTTDVITSGMLKSDTALIDKIFATDANIGVLTAKTAFVNSVKAVNIAADRITTGTLNAANVNIINLNASKIATGTITGVNSTWNLNNGVMQFSNPTTGDNLQFDQGQITFQNGAQTRYLKYNAEGLQLAAGLGNTGTSLNTSLHLIGGAVGSHQYIQFASKQSSGILQRITAVDVAMKLQHANNGGYVEITNYNGDAHEGKLLVGEINIKDADNDGLRIVNNRIESNVRSGSHNIFITPQGTGSVIIGDRGLANYWNIHASDFVKQSTRKSKQDIKPIETKGLDVIGRLTPVSYKKKDKVAQGIIETELGFIAEDSLEVATVDGLGIYDSHITAYLVKAVQELDKKIKQLESGK